MLSSKSKKKKTKKSSKMLRRRERGEVSDAPEIPLDLQIEILNRLPIKSLARFKCVSKLWFSLIRSKGYLFASPPRLYISLVEMIRGNHVNSIFSSLASTSNKSVLLSLASTSSTAFDLDTRKHGIGGKNMMALRGLILYSFHGQACIYNPTTGQRVILPAMESNNLAEEEEEEMVKSHVYFFGYDPVIEQYKVVCSVVAGRFQRMIYVHHWVFLLEAGSSWKRIKCDHPHAPTRQRLCINGVIYYFAFSYDFGVQFMSFDVRSEEFSMIQLPHAVSKSWMLLMHVGLIEYGGKPTLIDYKDLKDSLVKLWVLEHTGKWSLVLQSCQMHFVPSRIYFEVIGTTQNGEVVLKPEKMSYPYYILYYDLHKKDLRRIDIRGIPDHEVDPDKSIFYMAMMDTGESIMHLKI